MTTFSAAYYNIVHFSAFYSRRQIQIMRHCQLSMAFSLTHNFPWHELSILWNDCRVSQYLAVAWRILLKCIEIVEKRWIVYRNCIFSWVLIHYRLFVLIWHNVYRTRLTKSLTIGYQISCTFLLSFHKMDSLSSFRSHMATTWFLLSCWWLSVVSASPTCPFAALEMLCWTACILPVHPICILRLNSVKQN